VITAATVALSSARRARRGTVDDAEQRVFHAINRAPDALLPPVWLVMQSGSLGAVAVVVGVLHRRGCARAATTALFAGTAVWGGAKLVKPVVGRGRPSEYVESTQVRGAPQSGLGFPSGHAAVAMTLALVATEGRPVAIRRSAIGVALATGIARIYVGAHLPLDVVGGSAVGVIVGLLAADVVAVSHTGA